MIDYTQYINDYLSGKLSAEQRAELEAKLALDQDLQEEFQIVSSSREYLKAKAMLDEMEGDPDLEEAESLVQQHLNGESQDLKRNEELFEERDRGSIVVGSGSSKGSWVLTALAAAAFLAGVFFVVRSFTHIDSSKELYDRYYQPLSQEVFDRETVRGDPATFFYLGKQCYLKEDYACALVNFRKIPEGSFYQGLAFIGKGEFENAAMAFQIHLSMWPEHQEVHWYMGLAYLGLNEPQSAKSYFELLTRFPNSYQADALKILKKIDKLQTAGRN